MAAAVAADAQVGFFPISEISSYHSKWVIKARVTAKGQLRSFNSKNGQAMQVFDCSLLDESGEIRASFFGELASKYFNLLEQGKVFTFSRGGCKIANRQYNRCNHRYELVFDRDGLVEPATDDGNIETVRFNFVDLRTVQSKTLPCSVDICGIIVKSRPFVAFTSKNGKELVKRDLTIADDTATSMEIAIWGDRAKQEDKVFEGNPVVCLKGISVKEFKGGRNGSLEQAGAMVFDSTLPDAERVRQWWKASGGQASFTSLSLAQEGVTDLATLQTKALPCTVELCGVVVNFKPSFAFTSQAGKDLVKREIVVADHTGLSMQVTLWGDRAQQEDKVFDGGALVLLQGVLVKEWNGGRSGSLLEAGSLIFSPTTPEAEKVRLWWSTGGSSQSLTALSQEGAGGASARLAAGRACSVAEMRRAAELVSTQPEVFCVISRLALVQMKKQGEIQPLMYMACQESKAGSSLPCNKRVGEDGFCPACGRAGKAAPRMNIRCRFSDHSDSAWLTTFHEAAQGVLGITAEQAMAIESGENGREALEAAIRRRYFQHPLQVSVRAKMDMYNGEQRTNITCFDARPVSYGQQGRTMLKSIKEMLEQQAKATLALSTAAA
mmetsp:Transcript_127334/g.368698  ORF Transcript_127334/g.368698 Transcript_127334/m.368698 type:complete len:608 (+) Transcript_127334:57-1880(+)